MNKQKLWALHRWKQVKDVKMVDTEQPRLRRPAGSQSLQLNLDGPVLPVNFLVLVSIVLLVHQTENISFDLDFSANLRSHRVLLTFLRHHSFPSGTLSPSNGSATNLDHSPCPQSEQDSPPQASLALGSPCSTKEYLISFPLNNISSYFLLPNHNNSPVLFQGRTYFHTHPSDRP